MSRTPFRPAFLVALAVSSAAVAAPTVYPRPEITHGATVNNSSKATVLRDSLNPKTVYVMPPALGSSTLSSINYNANVEYCDDMRGIQAASLLLARTIETLYMNIDAEKIQLDALVAKTMELLEAKTDFIGTNAIRMSISDNIEEVAELSSQLLGLYDQRKACTDAACRQAVQVQVDALRPHLVTAYSTGWSLMKTYGSDYEQIADYIDEFVATQDNLQAIAVDVDVAVEQLSKVRSELLDMYRTFAALEGAVSTIAYDTGWDDAVMTVKAENPGFNVQAIGTSDVQLNFSALPGYGTPSYLQSLPQILGYSIAGKDYDPQDPSLSLLTFPEFIAGSIRLSLVGACPQRFPADYDIPKTQQGTPLVGAIATYAYPTVHRTTVDATINLWTFYQHYKQVQLNGGLVRAPSEFYEALYDNGHAGVALTILEENQLTPDERRSARDEVLEMILMSMLPGVAIPSYGGAAYSTYQTSPLRLPAGALAVPGTGATGACGWFSFDCKHLSWLFPGVDALLDGTRMEANFQKRHDHTVTRRYSPDVLQMRPGVAALSYAQGETL